MDKWTDDQILEHIYNEERGWNPTDPSIDGVMQGTLNDFNKSKESDEQFPRSIETLRDMDEIERKPYILRVFSWYCLTLKSGVHQSPWWFRPALLDSWINSKVFTIKTLQRKLVETGHLTDPLPDGKPAIDGVAGRGTREALQEFFDDLEERLKDDPNLDNEFLIWWHEERKQFYIERGWTGGHLTRTARSLALSLDMVKDENEVLASKVDDDDEDLSAHIDDELETNVDTGDEIRREIEMLKIEQQRQNEAVTDLNRRIAEVSAETNQRIDRLVEKLNEVLQ